MSTVLNFLLRLLLLLAGLVAAASLLVVSVALLAVWGLRAAWGRLTGRPVDPLVMRMGAGSPFADLFRRAGTPPPSRTPRSDAAAGPRARLADVTDVEPK